MDIIDLTNLEIDVPVIDLSECTIENTSHKFGEDKKYVYVKVIFGDNIEASCLLTKNQIEVGIKRALKNQEDVELTESFKKFIEQSLEGEEE